MIPKIIHYCWFGRGKKPKEIEACIQSWKNFFVGWDIIEWNEDNYDVNLHQYAREAYALKKWAFVSDLARLDILYKYGGIYLDTDVEFIKPLPMEYLEYKGFCGFEYTYTIAPGLIFAMEKNSQFIKEVLDSYDGEHFEIHSDGVYKTVNTRITDILLEYGLRNNNEFQIVREIAIFPPEYFCGYDTDVREPAITEKTICWHHYLGSWSRHSFKRKCQDMLKVIIGIGNYKKILGLIRKIRRK